MVEYTRSFPEGAERGHLLTRRMHQAEPQSNVQQVQYMRDQTTKARAPSLANYMIKPLLSWEASGYITSTIVHDHKRSRAAYADFHQNDKVRGG